MAADCVWTAAPVHHYPLAYRSWPRNAPPPLDFPLQSWPAILAQPGASYPQARQRQVPGTRCLW